VSEYRARGDKESEGRFVALMLLVDTLTGLVLVAAAAVFYYVIPGVFRNSFSGGEVRLLQQLFILLVFNGVLSLVLNLTTGVMKSYNEFGLLKVVNIVGNLIRVSSVVLLLLLGYRAFAVVLVDTLLTCITLIFAIAHCTKKLNVRPNFKLLTYSFAREILSYSLVVFVSALAFQLFNSADTVIIGIKISSSAVAIYSIGVVISSLFFSLSVVISDVLMPEVVTQVSQGADSGQLTDYMVKIGRIKLLILALPTIGFAFLGKGFVALWVGPSYVEAFYVALIVVVPSMLAGLCDVGLYVMWAMNKHRVQAVVSLAVAMANIVITVILVDVVGILGAAIGTSIAWVLGYLIFNNLYFHRALKLDMKRFFSQTFSGIWIAIAVAAMCAAVVSMVGRLSWITLAMQVVLVSVVYVGCAWLVSLNDDEKAMIKGILELPRSR
jgi:O-antigen/teichoic acid export membrane protein